MYLRGSNKSGILNVENNKNHIMYSSLSLFVNAEFILFSGIGWLREWLIEMENQLEPLDFRMEWTKQKLQFQIERHKVSQIYKTLLRKHARIHTFHLCKKYLIVN